MRQEGCKIILDLVSVLTWLSSYWTKSFFNVQFHTLPSPESLILSALLSFMFVRTISLEQWGKHVGSIIFGISFSVCTGDFAAKIVQGIRVRSQKVKGKAW